jgi:tetratricopeptide (TPR) repeat protein
MAGKVKKSEKAKGKSKGKPRKAARPLTPEQILEKAAVILREMEARNASEFQALTLLEQLDEIEDPAQARDIAQKALALDPRSVVAWMELAMACDSAEEALPNCERAFEIITEDLRGSGITFEEDGALTGRLEAALYARPRKLLADCLAELGRGEEAMAHYAELLRLDPSDVGGARYPVAAGMLAAGEHDLLGELCEAFESDDSGMWLFTRALLEFRVAGDSAATRKALKRARAANPQILGLLVDEDADLPEDWELEADADDYLEALQYAEDFGGAWTETPGALHWLTAQ